ncbi:uncharacterized protein LOC127866894 isoform X1 [Dreissena polymorpha]|uniref:uncharacterized protein LOC127866894 isoform X1 n=1 Tax=Dreissena polymorpha TaxID=45954 RepID=UPI002263D92E|nr:uncharacterized protein LOC127866894 isoform X1 [Dreissena polymorpha]
MADDAVRSVLHSIGLHSLYQNFMSQKIDSIEICKSLEDNQLTNLGLVTIGERIKFKNAVQHWQSMPIMPMAESDTAASGSRISTDATFRERNSLFMPSRCRQPSTSTSVGKRKRPQTWTANFMCLSNNHQNKVPNSAEKECLYKAGLGMKKVTFEGDAKEQSVHDTIIKEFPKLEQCGGFELLRCNSSCRVLKQLNCKWDVKTLKSVVGPQGKFYIRPIQKCLTVEVVTEDEETELMTKCDICKQEVSLGQIRNHVESCIATNLDHTETYLYTSQGNSDEELPESASEIIHQQLVQELPAVIHLFTPQQSNPLTVKMLTHLLNPQFSAEGSNRRQRENSTYTLFIKYMREAAKDAFQNPTGFSSAVCVLLLERRRRNDTTHNITNHHQHQHQHPPPPPQSGVIVRSPQTSRDSTITLLVLQVILVFVFGALPL